MNFWTQYLIDWKKFRFKVQMNVGTGKKNIN